MDHSNQSIETLDEDDVKPVKMARRREDGGGERGER